MQLQEAGVTAELEAAVVVSERTKELVAKLREQTVEAAGVTIQLLLKEERAEAFEAGMCLAWEDGPHPDDDLVYMLRMICETAPADLAPGIFADALLDARSHLRREAGVCVAPAGSMVPR